MSEQELEGRILKKANPKTIQDKFLVGYQGWFTCSGDGKPMDPNHHGWMHWFNKPIPDGGRPNTGLWPDVSEYSPSELFPAPDVKKRRWRAHDSLLFATLKDCEAPFSLDGVTWRRWRVLATIRRPMRRRVWLRSNQEDQR